MAKRQAPSEVAASDCLEAALHPRLTMHLRGHAPALALIGRALRSGRPPQAWLLCGPPGIGKATLAYRIARYLLTYGARAGGPADLAVEAESEAARQVAAGAHPGLLTLKRTVHPDTGKLMNVLAVDEVRKLGAFFGMTSGAGGWRVALIDAADDMNEAAANALLKLLEEPPARAMLLLVCHAPGRMLPTIRSRCQRVNLRPLSPAEMDAELRGRLPDLSDEDRQALIRLAGGSPGAALQLASGDGMMLAREADALIDRADAPDIVALLAMADKVGRMTDGLSQLGDFLRLSLADRIRARALAGQGRLDRWMETFEKVGRLFDRTAALHLDPRQTVLSAQRALSDAARRVGPV